MSLTGGYSGLSPVHKSASVREQDLVTITGKRSTKGEDFIDEMDDIVDGEEGASFQRQDVKRRKIKSMPGK